MAEEVADLRGVVSRGLWALQCRLNKPLPFGVRSLESVRFVTRGATQDVLNGAPAPKASLVMGITTHARAESCARLLRSLQDEVAGAGLDDEVFVVVVRDTSEHDYRAVLETLEGEFAGRFAFYEGERWMGKPGRYRTYQVIFDVVRALEPRAALLLEDDVVPKPELVARGLEMFERLDDPRKAVLYLAAFEDDEPDGRWVKFSRRPVPSLGIRQTQWFDLHAFVAGPRFFECLDWRLFAPHAWRWHGNPTRSSGVSEQFTLRLQGRATIYQVKETLVFHGKEPSVLNVEARQARSLNNFPGK